MGGDMFSKNIQEWGFERAVVPFTTEVKLFMGIIYSLHWSLIIH